MKIKVNVKIDFQKIKKEKENSAKKDFEIFAEIIKNKIDEKTPEKTKELIWNNIIWETIRFWKKYLKKIYNITPYVIYVEYWVWKVFNYHKWKKIYYTWIWAWMFLRTKKEVIWNFRKLLNK